VLQEIGALISAILMGLSVLLPQLPGPTTVEPEPAPPAASAPPTAVPPRVLEPPRAEPAPPKLSPTTPGGGFGAVPPNLGAGKQTKLDEAYGRLPRQRLDIYGLGTPDAAPIVLFVHGGGWSSGDKAQFGWLGDQLSQKGLVLALMNYQLSPAVQHPTHAQDVARAVAWLVRNGARYGGDPSRIYLVGHSAGAHLASLVALDPTYLAAENVKPSVVRGVVGIAGAAYDLDVHYAATPLASIFAPAFGPDPTRWSKAAPLRYVRKGAPPFLIVHGLNDGQVPAAAAQTFAVALQREGVPAELHLLPGQDHFSVLPWTTAYLPAWILGR
jgi:acetyl esterase/lipase